MSLMSPVLAGRCFTTSATWEALTDPFLSFNVVLFITELSFVIFRTICVHLFFKNGAVSGMLVNLYDFFRFGIFKKFLKVLSPPSQGYGVL